VRKLWNCAILHYNSKEFSSVINFHESYILRHKQASSFFLSVYRVYSVSTDMLCISEM
jgi:hypothetical protein